MLNIRLNSKQLEAVSQKNGYYMVMAGAGTGKTRVLTYRIIKLIQSGIDENAILAFSFTNKATREMKSRLSKYFSQDTDVCISTFHSYAYHNLIRYSDLIGFNPKFRIIDEEDREKMLNEIIKEFNLTLQLNKAKRAVSSVKNHNTHDYKTLREMIELNILYQNYLKLLKEQNKVDLDDLLLNFYKLLKINHPKIDELLSNIKYVLVDEFQDTNKIQYEIVIMLTKRNKNLFCVGDEDQSIYSFRGSNTTNLHDFIYNKNAKVIKLEENYRSSKSILDVANKCIKNNIRRNDKNLYVNNLIDDYQVQKCFFEDTLKEQNYITQQIRSYIILKGYKYSDIAILYRNNNLSIDYENALVRNKIPFTLAHSSLFYKSSEIKTIIEHIRFIQDKTDNMAFLKVLSITPIKPYIVSNIMLKSKTKKITYYESLKELSVNDSAILNVIELIEDLKLKFEELEPIDFIKHLIDKTKYLEYLKKEDNVKSKLNNIYIHS